MGGVSRTPGPVWGSLFLLVAMLSVAAAVPVPLSFPSQRPPQLPHYYNEPLTTHQPRTSRPIFTIFPNTTPSPPTTFPPFTFPSSTRPTTTLRPHCTRPEECCAHPFDSEEFDACCEDHGCCPMECPVTLPGGDLSPIKDCYAWECCVHHEGSPKHQECCKRHGCCPVCERVSSGCCYNGVNYAFRSLVLDMPEVCLQLVCAAKLLPDIPFLVATIAAVKTCSFTDMSDACVACPVHQCVDDMGLLRDEGDVWDPLPCTQCECLNGRVICRILLIDCQPPPRPGCVAMPGPCCPVYHCDDGCIDDSGVFRPLGSQWPTEDPCTVFVCTETGVHRVVTRCKPPPRPHEGCHLQPVEGQCCPEWNCSRCLDTDGTFHPLNDVWQTGCLVKECKESGVVIRDRVCPPPGPPPHDTCFLGLPDGGCCEQWQCDGCWDNGVLHPPGEVWPSDDPCVNKVCTGQVPVLRPVDCPDFPKPHESCFEFTPEGECCPTWNCSGCLDVDGNFHPQFEEWQTDPCTIHVCHLDGITTKTVTCPPLGSAPHYTCHLVPTEGGCCKEWKCNGCIDDDGVFRPLGAQWLSKHNPCKRLRCTHSGITSFVITCDPTPPPHDDCFLQPVEGQCCPRWNCSGCFDDDGAFRPLGAEWQSKENPCKTLRCTQSGITSFMITCDPTPPPHKGCFLQPVEGQCCPRWNCSGCFDDDGAFRPLGAEWQSKDNPCKTLRCTQSGITSFVITCDPTPPPHKGCFLQPVEGQCCPRWNCSGCVDDSGMFHPLYHEWKSDPCTTHICKESGIQTIQMSCLPPTKPHKSCNLISLPGVCCPVWDCRYGRNSNACHEGDQTHEDGTVWPTDDPCERRRCVSGTVAKEVTSCSMVEPPTDNCFKEDPMECCQTWNCSGCRDSDGVFHKLHEEWRPSPCIINACHESGIAIAFIDCPEEKPRPGCSLVTDPGECCPHRECSGCVDQSGNPRQDGEQWPSTSDPCLMFECVSSEVKSHSVQCNETLPPLPICFPSMEEHRCCPAWNCSGCLDEESMFHLIGESWMSFPCANLTCTSQGIAAAPFSCPDAPHPGCVPELLLPDQCCPHWLCDDVTNCAAVTCLAQPPGKNCHSYTPPGQCCPVFDCGLDCSLVLCEGPPPGQDCTPYTPPGQCCPVYSCRPIPLPDCSTVKCQGPPAGQECEPHTSPGHCCPMYRCRPNRPAAECATVLCMAPPPGQTCTAHTPPGECCPVFECRPPRH